MLTVIVVAARAQPLQPPQSSGRRFPKESLAPIFRPSISTAAVDHHYTAVQAVFLALRSLPPILRPRFL